MSCLSYYVAILYFVVRQPQNKNINKIYRVFLIIILCDRQSFILW